MKRVYVTPDFEVERYEMNASIAANCSNIQTQGPDVGSHDPCEGWPIIPDEPDFEMMTLGEGKSFYSDGTCNCYYSSGGEGYFTS